MITIVNIYNRLNEYRGLSTDNKPTNVDNGCTFFEMDTSKIFIFDATNSLWREI